jgi:hypothetical protein
MWDHDLRNEIYSVHFIQPFLFNKDKMYGRLIAQLETCGNNHGIVLPRQMFKMERTEFTVDKSRQCIAFRYP